MLPATHGNHPPSVNWEINWERRLLSSSDTEVQCVEHFMFPPAVSSKTMLAILGYRSRHVLFLRWPATQVCPDGGLLQTLCQTGNVSCECCSERLNKTKQYLRGCSLKRFRCLAERRKKKKERQFAAAFNTQNNISL